MNPSIDKERLDALVATSGVPVASLTPQQNL
jgi:hypothetical protein